jgi:hypothetical protein
MQGTRACEVEMSASKAARTRALIERLTGKACPCDRGLVCPLFPGTQAELRQQNRQQLA